MACPRPTTTADPAPTAAAADAALATLKAYVSATLASTDPSAPPSFAPTTPPDASHLPRPRTRTASVSSLHGRPESVVAPLRSLYYDLLHVAAQLHGVIFTEHLTPLGTPAVGPNGGGAEEPGDALRALEKTVSDQKRLLHKSKIDLDVERGLNKVLRNENAELKKHMVQLAVVSEQEEEALTNRFLARIDELNKEKARIISEVEREEEFITNTLQKRLVQLQREKIAMENQLEQEQEAMVNRLAKQLDALRSPSSAGASLAHVEPTAIGALSGGTSPAVGPMESLPRRRSSTHGSIHDVPLMTPPPMADILRAEVQGLRFKVQELERENEAKTAKLKAWRDELLVLRQKFGQPIEDLFQDQRSTPASPSPRARRISAHSTTS
ncbi:hypothetical protein AMAG_15115 [Allomyces macrogynus ATCC 38327]|uniref:Uncharacterized protein n=1 Tax=Allomyces macrogynus (strain ATCC 38327) TaxID=578462 RepID=A0A0L0T6G6_ALLM3|nr:hypothetical protein AMAG_15115 [Allomyces macrogynus ATCC 38327]|eukprot:KNE70139.1 hypothetical protein AMAG_15115 [Allomyces macrogynus ATCC 38327]